MASAMSSITSAIGISGLGFNRTCNFVSSRVAVFGGVSTTGNNFRSVRFGKRFVMKAIEAETLVQEQTGEQPELVSPSDILTMLFQAEGTVKESAIPNVTKALEEIEGVTNLKVQLLEGLASVELTKQTTIQATGVASTLVESIQGSGFKLQTLYLSFLDEADTAE